MIEIADIQIILEAIGVVLLAIIALYNKIRTVLAGQTAVASVQTATTNQVMAVQGTDTRLRDSQGNLVTNQVGSQYWMDAKYAGVEPLMIEKAMLTDAQAAYDQAVLKAIALKNQYGDTKLNDNLKKLL